jgi:hypothetical protein
MDFYEGSPLIINRRSLEWRFFLVIGPKNNEPWAFLSQGAGEKGIPAAIFAGCCSYFAPYPLLISLISFSLS